MSYPQTRQQDEKEEEPAGGEDPGVESAMTGCTSFKIGHEEEIDL